MAGSGRDLEYYVRLNASNALDKKAYLSLIQPGVSGGRIPRQAIDVIDQHPDATEISVSGLTQNTFEYFIEYFGHQFKAIIFWKCPLIVDLGMLESLDKLEYVVFYWNQRAERLWDFSRTASLKGLWYDDFTRMHDISQIARSPALEELHFGDMIWNKYVLNSLEPLKECTSLTFLSFSARKIVDERIEPISYLNRLQRLDFPANLFTTRQVAWVKAHLPDTIDSKVLHASQPLRHPVHMTGRVLDTHVVGKRKPFLDSLQDREKLEKYVRQFDDMVHWYSAHPDAAPEDYR